MSNFKIKFVGKKLGREPLRFITDGNDLIVLPENQSRAFVHEHASAILRHAPELYKRVARRAKAL